MNFFCNTRSLMTFLRKLDISVHREDSPNFSLKILRGFMFDKVCHSSFNYHTADSAFVAIIPFCQFLWRHMALDILMRFEIP